MSSARRRAFSVLELLIVLAVVGIAIAVIGLVVIGVRNVQEAAARTRTISHLKRIALAAHGSNDVHKRLPPGYGNGYGLIGDKDLPRSVHIHFMPYVERDDQYKKIIQSGISSDEVKLTEWQTDKSPFGFHHYLGQSPADPTVGAGQGVHDLAANFRIFCNTELQKQVGGPDFVWLPLENPRTVPAIDTRIWDSAAKIPKTFEIDGTSNTIMFATRYAHCGGMGRGTINVVGGSMYAAHPGTTFGAFFGVEGANAPTAPDASATVRPIFQLAPRKALCNPQPSLFAQSFGRGGLQVALADASCRNIAPNISVRTWNLAIQPNDGRLLPSDWSN